MKNCHYSTVILPEFEIGLIICYYHNEVIYHLWENESVFILIEEYKSKNFPQKPMITNISKTEVENLFMQKLHFKGLGDENAIFLNWELWKKHF